MRLTDRIARLEAERQDNRIFWAWRNEGETAEQAEARYTAEHPDAAGRITVVGWLAD